MRIGLVMGIWRTGAWTPSRHLSPPPQEQSGALTPARPRPQRGPRQPTQWTGSRGRRSARPQTPHATVKGTPPGTPCRRPTTPSQVGGNRDPTAPPKARQTEQGTAAGHAGGHGQRGTALPAPSAGTTRDARATPPSGGGSGHRESASAHTRKGHAGTTGRAIGPSARNAQTAWNGVPASEGKGHPDGTARHTQRGTRGAGRGMKVLPWVVDGAGGLGAGKTSGAGTRGVDLNAAVWG